MSFSLRLTKVFNVIKEEVTKHIWPTFAYDFKRETASCNYKYIHKIDNELSNYQIETFLSFPGLFFRRLFSLRGQNSPWNIYHFEWLNRFNLIMASHVQLALCIFLIYKKTISVPKALRIKVRISRSERSVFLRIHYSIAYPNPISPRLGNWIITVRDWNLVFWMRLKYVFDH